MIFSNRHDLRSLSAEPGIHYEVMISNLRNTIALDYHYEKQLVFWSDVIADKIYRGSIDTNSENGERRMIPVVFYSTSMHILGFIEKNSMLITIIHVTMKRIF